MWFEKAMWTVLIIVSVVSVAMAQGNNCPAIVTTVLETVENACHTIGRNEVCYGNDSVTALDFQSVPVDTFTSAGDTTSISNVSSLSTAPFDLNTNTWGIAIMVLQADFPETLPGQNVTIVAFGDTELTNQVVPDAHVVATMSATATGNINVRSGPGTSYEIVDNLVTGEVVTLNGRGASGEWVQISLDNDTGWVFAPLLTIDGNPALLAQVGENNDTFTSPMQAFRLQTGIGAPACDDVPPDGLLIQAPTDTVVHFNINGIEVEVGSTAFLTMEVEELNIFTFDGSVGVTSNGETQIAEPGYMVSAADDAAPDEPEPYDYDAVEHVPVELLPEEVVVPFPILGISGFHGWVDTGIDLEVGDTITMTAGGIVNFWDNCESEKVAFGQPDIDCSSLILGPNGGDPFTVDGEPLPSDMSLFPVPDAPPHSLVAQIGGSTFFVGHGGTFTVEESGRLQLRVNDVDTNNVGLFYVAVALESE